MISMEPTDTNADTDQQDPFEDLIEFESITSSYGIFPEYLFFWQRRRRKRTATS